VSSALRVAMTVCGLLAVWHAAPARAETPQSFCKRWSGFHAPPGDERFGRTLLRQSDLLNGVTWLGVGGAIHFGTDPIHAWDGTNGFDRGVRDGLVAGSRSGRDDASTASDVLLGVTVLAPILADVGVRSLWQERDCDRALEITSDWVESLGFIWMLSEATKSLTGRERPYGLECDGDPGYSGNCDADSRDRSFFSGHASLSAGAAALLCKDAFRREVWGDSRLTQSVVCGLGVGASLATGLTRVVGDRHWFTDTLVGWAVGGLVGWFDLPGPFDLLRFRYPRNGPDVQGAFLPVVSGRSVGLGVAMRF